jgi:hypothetical protein
MTRRSMTMMAALLLVTAGSTVAAELNFGGDLGFLLFDNAFGTGLVPTVDSTGTRVGVPFDTTGRVEMQFGSHGLGLYWNVQLSDQVSVNALTEVGASTGASPSLGKILGSQFAEAGTQKALSVPEANISVMLPWELQMTAGIIRPIFSEDYGEKKGYQEGNRLFKSSANGYGGEWHDLGIELYKSIEPGGGLSIPTYAYLLAGEEMYGDNNNNKALLFHVAPGFWKLRVLGSYGFGKYDALDSFAFTRYAAGLGGDFGKLWFRTELFGGSWYGAVAYNEANKDSLGNIVPVTFTRKPIAYYVKAGYNFIPDKLGIALTYDQSSPDWTTRGKLGYTTQSSATTTDAGESYTTIGATVQYWVIPGSSILLEYNKRITLGWRTVF